MPLPRIVLFILFFLTSIHSQETVTSYSRDAWPHWIDIDNDCQNLRQELLIEKSLSPVTFTNDSNCTVRSGRWSDPYSNNTFTLASDVDIDHVIPLYYAHHAGGSNWSAIEKQRFANDVENLLIMSDELNRKKSSSGPSLFLPEYNQCEYVKIWLNISSKYELDLSVLDAKIIMSTLNDCPS